MLNFLGRLAFEEGVKARPQLKNAIEVMSSFLVTKLIGPNGSASVESWSQDIFEKDYVMIPVHSASL